MTEVEWTDEGAEKPAKKGRIPRWLLVGCGCGCLAVVAAVGAATWYLVGFYQEATDPEKQWPKVARVLPFDERPAGLELELGNPVPFLDRVFEMYKLTNAADDYTATVMHFKSGPKEELDQMFDPDPEGTVFGLGRPVDPVAGALEIQGRQVRTLRFRTVKGEGKAVGPGIRVDLSRPGRMLAVEMRRIGDQPLSDEEVLEFFAFFDVWREG